jgi:hypothetical protein
MIKNIQFVEKTIEQCYSIGGFVVFNDKMCETKKYQKLLKMAEKGH